MYIYIGCTGLYTMDKVKDNTRNSISKIVLAAKKVDDWNAGVSWKITQERKN